MEWFSLHLQVRGAFTTLDSDKARAPTVWASTFRHGRRAVPVTKLLQDTYGLGRQLLPFAEGQRPQWAGRLCCALTQRQFVPTNLGCAPWRLLNGYTNSTPSASTAAAASAPGFEQAMESDWASCGEPANRILPFNGHAIPASSGMLWEQPAPRHTENIILHPDKPQQWANGAMKCDLVEGYFNGWRGY